MADSSFTSPATISHLAYELGTPRPIADLPEFSDRPELLAALESEASGLRYYLESDESLWALAAKAAESTLRASGHAPAEIDAVVFATDSWQSSRDPNDGVGAFLTRLQLVNAYPIGVTFSDCANLPIALRVASSLVRAAEFRCVLVVSVDLARLAIPPRQTRLLFEGVAVASDAAASGLVSSNPRDAFSMKAFAQETDPGLHAAGDGHRRSLATRILAHRNLFDSLFEQTKLAPSAVRQLFPNNFALQVVSPFLADCGFDQLQLYLQNVRRIGHCFGSDCLINLVDFARQQSIAAADKFVILGSGQTQLGAVLLEANRDINIDVTESVLA